MAVAATLPLGAQEKWGTIEGLTRDTDGDLLPGVTIVVSGANMMGERVSVSDRDGDFRFVMIPPGQYRVSASLSGFQPVSQDRVPVALGKTAHLDITMESGFGDTVEVIAESFLIDTTSSTVGANITDEFISSLPTDRQYQMVMSILPGAVENDNAPMHGASVFDNIYLVDGADSTDPLSRTWAVAINFDNIQEVQVQTGGIAAEYGKGTGAVVNLLTKSGSNQLHGVIRYYLTDTDWNEEARGDRWHFVDATRYLTESRGAANLGGPVLRDHLWFFVSYENRNKSLPTSYWASPQHNLDAAASGDTSSHITHGEEFYQGHYAQAKLTWSPSPSNTFMVQYMEDPIDIPNAETYGGSTSYVQTADLTQEQGGWTAIADWTGVLSNSAFLNFKYNIKRASLNGVPNSIGTSYRMDTSAGRVYWGGSLVKYYTNRDHDIYAASWSQFVDDLGGNHNFKAGLEYSNISIRQLSDTYPGGEYIRIYPDGETPYYRYVMHQWRGEAKTTNDNWSLYLQDSWMVSSKLTLNLGLRVETLVEQTPQGYKGLDWGLGDRIAPRLGFACALGSHGHSNLHGSAGRYHDTMGNYVTNSFVVTPNLQYTFQYWSFALGDWDPDRAYYFDIGAAHADQFVLDSPYMDEITLGYEGRITDTMSWSVDGIWRTWKKGIEDDDGQYFDEFPDNPPDDGNYVFMNLGKFRGYKGIEFTLRKRLGAGKLQYLASYTYSKAESLWGNNDYVSVYADNPFTYYGWWGPPIYDIRHMVKFNGSYFLPLGFQVGANFTYWSGFPYTIYGTVQTNDESEWGARTFGSYYPEGRGSRRLGATYRVDFRAEKNFNLGRDMSIGLYVDIFNLTDTQRVQSNNPYVGVIAINQPGQQIDNFGNAVDFSDFDPEPDRWQAPRSYFFGAKFEF